MKILLEIIGAALFSALTAVVLIEWAVGCGETYTDAQGTVHSHECVFIKLPNS